MKIFLASCLQDGAIRQKERIAALERLLKAKGHSVAVYIYDLHEVNEEPAFGELSEAILKCDVYIAEMSLPSQTLGFQIAFALNNTLACLYLFDEQTQGMPATSLAQHPSRLLKFVAYNSQNVSRKLDAFLSYAEKQMSTKRTSFMSTKCIDEYLARESARLGVHKAELIRQILFKEKGAFNPVCCHFGCACKNRPVHTGNCVAVAEQK
ncbi:MAG TPA: hypothetical protein VLF60_05610 [Candidatus Saccharimonadales bacterium]|nr:hypothetical protein [Candidatus Saccharimonadales bacterium]